jgi:hypothetical protein
MKRASSCHATARKPSLLLALVAASVVASFNATWLRRPVKKLGQEHGVRPERVSRLKTTLLQILEALVRRASRRGRPRKTPASRDTARVKALEALLAVAADLLRRLPIRKRPLQELLVQARDRLKREHELSTREFATALGLSERTLRYWARRPPAPPKPAFTAAEPTSPRSRRRVGRFGLDVTLPGLQGVTDTSSWEFFGVALEVVAVQDPGNRDRSLWEAFVVDDHEDHEAVLQAVGHAFAHKPGAQILSDQGSPYMAQATEKGLESMALEHAPQCEGRPTEKATLERSFRTVKEAFAPLVELTRKLAERLPALHHPGLAKTAGRLVLAGALRLYRAGWADSPAARSDDPVVLQTLAEEQRERARAEDRSVKLALERIHQAYAFPGSTARFVRAHRIYRLHDILEAEARMGTYACRCHAKRCDRYYAAILRAVAKKNRLRRHEARQRRLQRQHDRRQRAELAAQQAHRETEPPVWIASALDILQSQYHPAKRALLFEGKGPGRGRLRQALEHLRRTAPLLARDQAEVGWSLWRNAALQNGFPGVRHVRRVFDDLLATVLGPENPAPHSTPTLVAAMLNPTASHPNQRPPPG